MDEPYVSAKRNSMTGRWTGWVQFDGPGSKITETPETPDSYSTRDEAVAAVEAQHGVQEAAR